MSVSKTYCDGCYVTHSPLMCFNKPRRPLKTYKAIHRVGKSAAENQELRNAWIQANPGPWQCYLMISPMCLGYLDIDTLTLEHMVPKSHGEKYRIDFGNIKPSCVFCNSLKGSRSLRALARTFPHLNKYL